MKKRIVTDVEQISKFCAFQIMLAFSAVGFTVHKNGLDKLRRSLQSNLDLDRAAKQYDDFLLFRVNKVKGKASSLK